MKKAAYTAYETGAGEHAIACCVEGERGYHPVPDYGPYKDKGRAEGIATRLNERLGVEPKEATRIVMSTVRASTTKKRGRASVRT